MRLKSVLFSLAFAVLSVGPAAAHGDAAPGFSFAAGLVHPLGGLDHLLAMFAVGLLAAQLGGRALWLVPAAFVAMMVAGAMVAGALLVFSAINLPGVEYAISFSLLAIALPAAFALGMPDAEVLAYVAGFIFATAFVHAVGIGFGLATKGIPARVSAAAIGAVGLVLVVA